MHHLPNFIEPLLDLCADAGELICGHYNAPGTGDYQAKVDDSPLTQADLDSHDLLMAGLADLDPDVPILSEESAPQDMAQRRQWQRYWLVDPLDGTREFLARTGEFTINVALIEDHRPVLGVLYVPLERAAYAGIPGYGAFRYERAKEGSWSRCVLVTRRLERGAVLTLLASRRHTGPRLRGCLDWLDTHWGAVQRLGSGSALKFCQLAQGHGDFYPRFTPCCEWDTAAGQALLEAAGGKLVGLDGQPLRYNCRESLLSPNFYAFGDPSHALWQQLLQENGR